MSALTETELEEIERMARENAGEPYRGPLIALVGEVRRLRGIVLQECTVPPISSRAPISESATDARPAT